MMQNNPAAFAAKDVINALDDAIVIVDGAGALRLVNHSACRLFDRTEAELENISLAALLAVFPSGQSALAPQILAGTLRSCEVTAPDGHAIVSLSAYPLRDQTQEPRGTVCVIRDITRQKAAAQQARADTARQTELYEQARQQAAALEKANRVREDFLSVMSHELRTPLNVISGYTKLVQEGAMGEVTADQHKALDKVIHHTHELLFMVGSILDATKIESGALAVEREEFLLASLLDELKLLYDYPFGKPVTLEWDYHAELPLMASDHDKVKHILQNLINNALKFTEAGKVRVTARPSADGAQIEFTVSDSGIGISAEALPLIFDRFRQVDSSKTRGYGGVGLGLHIVKTFTEILGGQVKADSEAGKGSTFTVVLPVNLPSPRGSDDEPRRQIR